QDYRVRGDGRRARQLATANKRQAAAFQHPRHFGKALRMARHQDEPKGWMRRPGTAIDVEGDRFLRVLRAASHPYQGIRRNPKQGSHGIRTRIAAFNVDAIVLDVAGGDDTWGAEFLVVP